MREALRASFQELTSEEAELNIGQNAEKTRAGEHPGFEKNTWEGLKLSLNLIAEKGIKVVVNGGAQRPRALAEKVMELAEERKLKITVAFQSGDDLWESARELLKSNMTHLDSENENVKYAKHVSRFLFFICTNFRQTDNFLDDKSKPITSANAYCGARAIVAALRAGADIVICGRVSDASMTVGVAWWWHDWSDSHYDELAGSLIAGHLIECSAYTVC